jgi:hypothetical protein
MFTASCMELDRMAAAADAVTMYCEPGLGAALSVLRHCSGAA